MNGLANVSPGVVFADGDDRFDAVACLPATVWGFDLCPYRAARAHARRRQSRVGFLAAVCCGVIGVLLLQSWAQYERRLEDKRAAAIAQQVDALGPALSELGEWQALIEANRAQQAWRAALAPRRTCLLRLFDLLAATARTGVRIVDMQVRQGDQVGSAVSVASVASVDTPDRPDVSELRVHIAGLADDADTLAQWAADLAAQPGVTSVDLDGVHRLEDPRHESQADLHLSPSLIGPTRGAPDAPHLNVFRLTLTWRDPLGAMQAGDKTQVVSPNASLTLSVARS